MIGALRSLVIGRPLPTRSAGRERLGISQGIGAFGLDALSSVAYGPDEILYVLVLAGTAGVGYALPMAICIVVLLVIVVTSYRQTIFAYPHGGGSYTVARENLGTPAGLVAGAALMVDYVTTLAVSITAGVEAVIALEPSLDAHRVELSLVLILALVLINLRGVREAGAFFVVPTYVFVLSLGVLVALGLWRFVIGGATPPPQNLPAATEGVTLFLLLRAFAGGCTAMTGVEAIANGVPVFKKPESQHAARTLVVLALLLATLFLGVTYLGHLVGARPSDQASVIAQIGRAVAPGSVVFYAVQLSTALVLVLAGNTSFNGFPLLAAVMARDDYLPHQFAHRGSRLAYSNGIVVIGAIGALLIVVFRGSTHALIPLFAIGVFLSFTLSQSGMVRHWWRLRGRGWRTKLVINGMGAVTTAIVTGVVVATKFLQGAWIIVLIVPALVFAFRALNQLYARERAEIAPDRRPPTTRRKHRVIVPVAEINKAVQRTLEYALSSSNDVTAVHVSIDDKRAKRLKSEWKNWAPDVPLVVVPSEFREVVPPLIEYIKSEQASRADHQVMVMVPEVIPPHWFEEPVHNQTALALATALRHLDGVALGLVPYRLSP